MLGELRAAVAVEAADDKMKPDCGAPIWNAWVADGEQLNVALNKVGAFEPVKVEPAKKPTKRKKRGYIPIAKTLAEIKKLPLIDGPITWDVAHKMKKKLGASNLTQLRSDLFARQKLG
jgi:hypothetical protein